MSFPANEPDHHAAAAAAATDDVVMDEAAPPTNARAHWSTSHLFLGTSGTGKSTLANAAAGLPAFLTGLSPIGITQDVQYHDLGTGVRLIDTPGIDVDDVDPEADVAHLLARVPQGRSTTVALVVRIGGERHTVCNEDRELARIVQAQIAAMAGRDARCAIVFNQATLAARQAIKADPGSFLRQVFDESTVEDVGTVPYTVVPWFVDAAGDSNVMLPPSVQTHMRAFFESLPLMILEPLHTTAAQQQQALRANQKQRKPRSNGSEEQPLPPLPSWIVPPPFSHAPAASSASFSSPVAAAAAAAPAALVSTHTSEWPSTMPHVQDTHLLPIGPELHVSLPTPTTLAVSVATPSSPRAEQEVAESNRVESSPTPTTLAVSVAAPSSPRAADHAFAGRDSVLGALFSPPEEILFRGTLAQAQRKAYNDLKWLLVDVYDPSNLTSLARSRDVWHNETVKSIILDQFVFIQVPVYENIEGAEHVVIYEPSTGKRLAMIGGERDPTVMYRKAACLNDPNDVAEFLLDFTAENEMPDGRSGFSGVLAGASQLPVPVVGTTLGAGERAARGVARDRGARAPVGAVGEFAGDRRARGSAGQRSGVELRLFPSK